MPERCPLDAVVRGAIDCGDYSIEKVHFQSYPGFYVTGNLYRPKNKPGPFPVVLSPHGHWNNGRLYEAPDKEVESQLSHGWEKDAAAARYPMQARCATLAKMGCVVFFYDMVGYADADPEHFPHRQTYRDLDSDLHGLSVFGLQTWDSIRAIDFVTSLPDVDRSRIGITGASGGGSQTIMMMAVDDRPTCAAPVNMISAGEHQGGCVCENNSLLRLGTDNVELSATFAPRPFIHPTATGDWTKDYLEHGFPETLATYKLFGAEANVESMRQEAPHNYNLHAREAVYNFFNKHLKLGYDGVVTEPKFTPMPPKDLRVWDADHPRPADAVDAAGLKKYWVDMTAKQIEAVRSKDQSRTPAADAVLRPALIHMLRNPHLGRNTAFVKDGFGILVSGMTLLDTIPVLNFVTESDRPVDKPGHDPTAGRVVLLLPGGTAGAIKGDGTPVDLIVKLLAAGHTVSVPDVFGQGGRALPAPAKVSATEFYTGYNPTPLARRVQDILIVLGSSPRDRSDLVGLGETGPWCLLARAAAGERVDRAVIDDADGFDFDRLRSPDEPNYLPLALRYGGLWPLASLNAPLNLTLIHPPGNAAPARLKSAYEAAGASDELRILPDANAAAIVRALAR